MGARNLSSLFDKLIPREGTSSLKYDGREQIFGASNIQPMWVADMDFAAPEAVIRSLTTRAQHPIYGYTTPPDSLFDALISWMQLRHSWKIEREWIVLMPGVVASLNMTVLALTNAGDGIVVQPPVYFPFFSAANNADRRLIENPLILATDEIGNQQYVINFEHLEACAKEAKMLLLCSPHNPVGRVWTELELRKLLDISKRNDLIIVADEIHADLVYSDAKHHCLGKLAGESHQIITAVAPSKTFNIAGLGLSALIIPDESHRKSIQSQLNSLGVSVTNPFSLTAFEAAYREGGDWLDNLMNYLQATRDEALIYINKHLPRISVTPTQATFLLWLDCRKSGLTDSELQQFFIKEAQLGLSPGTLFGKGGEGFMRMNIAAPRANVMAALESLYKAFSDIGH